jgi:hypothetical protein
VLDSFSLTYTAITWKYLEVHYDDTDPTKQEAAHVEEIAPRSSLDNLHMSLENILMGLTRAVVKDKTYDELVVVKGCPMSFTSWF